MMRHLLDGATALSSGMLRSSQEDLPALERDAAEDRVARGRRLLEDLLEHEVLVAALLRRDRDPTARAASSSRPRVPE